MKVHFLSICSIFSSTKPKISTSERMKQIYKTKKKPYISSKPIKVKMTHTHYY